MLEKIAAIANPPPSDDGGSRVAPWALNWEKKPALRADGTQFHSRKLFAIAREHIRVFGPGPEGKRFFNLALERKRAISPDLANPSRTTRDRRNPFGEREFGNRTWAEARKRPFDDQPIDRIEALAQSLNRLDQGAARLYCALFLEQLRLGVRFDRPDSDDRGFGKDSRTLAVRLGAPRSSIRRWIVRAADLGILVMDPGLPHAKGRKGVSASYRLRTAATDAKLRAAAIVAAVSDAPSEIPPRKEAARATRALRVVA